MQRIISNPYYSSSFILSQHRHISGLIQLPATSAYIGAPVFQHSFIISISKNSEVPCFFRPWRLKFIEFECFENFQTAIIMPDIPFKRVQSKLMYTIRTWKWRQYLTNEVTDKITDVIGPLTYNTPRFSLSLKLGKIKKVLPVVMSLNQYVIPWSVLVVTRDYDNPIAPYDELEQ